MYILWKGLYIKSEVKAEANVKAKSLRTFVTNEFPELSLHAFRFSMLPYIDQQWMENIPLPGIEGCFKPTES